MSVRKRCDGIADCPFQTDETKCEFCADTISRSMRCSDSTKCVHKSRICNKKIDCSGGTDENCDDRYFWCPVNNKKIKYTKICDGREYCRNSGVDEIFETFL